MKLRNLVFHGLLLAASLTACDDDESGAAALADGGAPASAASLYFVATSISTQDESTLLVMTAPELDNQSLDVKKALQFPGGGEAEIFDGAYFIFEEEKKTVTRYELQGEALVAGARLNFSDRGFEYFANTNTFLDREHAYLINDAQLKMIEWNPSAMTVTATHDLSGLKREGWGHEFRSAFARERDGKLFIQWTYTNGRKDFINDFVLGVFDAKANSLKVVEDKSCPATAGFGGFFDEQGDLYLIADSFGLFTKFGGFKDPKEACILRVKSDQDGIDPTYKLQPKAALGGREPWGFYYAGNGVAYVTGVDPNLISQYASVYELIFAPVHTGFLLDLRTNTARELTALPPTGVGFESYRTDNRLFVARSTGDVRVFDIMTTQSTVYEIGADGTSTPRFALPGYIGPIVRVR